MNVRHPSIASTEVVNVKREGAGDGEVRDKPRQALRQEENKHANNVEMVMLYVLREDLYRFEVLSRQSEVMMPTLRQLVRIDVQIKARRRLGLTVRQICEGGLLWSYSDVRNTLESLRKYGIMIKQSGGVGRAALWSMSGKGRKLLRLYYEYLGGAHDDRLQKSPLVGRAV